MTLFHQAHSILELFSSLARKTHYDVARQGKPAARAPDRFHTLEVVRNPVSPAHGLQHTVAAGLYWQMHPVTQILKLVQSRHNICVKIPREGGSEFDPLHARRRHRAQESGEGGGAAKLSQAVVRSRAIAIDVLPYQLHLPVTLSAESANLLDDLQGRATALPPTRERDYAVGAKLITPLYDGNKRHVGRVALLHSYVPGLPFDTLSKIDGSPFAFERSFN